MSSYLRFSRNFFFITLFVLLFIQLIRLWDEPAKEESRNGKSLTEKLHFMEKDMQTFLASSFIDTICRESSLLKRNALWERFIEKTETKNYSVLVYLNSKIRYWSKALVVPECELLNLKEGSNFRRLDNGWYYIHQKTIDEAVVLSLLCIKSEYNYQNEYLKNDYNGNLQIPSYMVINPITYPSGFIIKDIGSQDLFRLCIDELEYAKNPSYLEITLWVLVFIFAYLSINNYAKHLWQRGEVWASVLFILAMILVLRSISLVWQLPLALYMLPLFSPDVYASNIFFPSLGDLLLNLLLLHWVVYFLFDKIRELNYRVTKPQIAYFITGIFVVGLFGFLDLLNYVFEGLVMNSNISFDLSNILSLNAYSLIGFFALSLMLYSYYLLTDTLISIFHQFYLSKREKLNVFILGLIVVFFFKYFFGNLNVLFFSNAIFLLVLERSKSKKRDYLSIPLVILVLSIFTIGSALRLDDFNNEKEKQNRQLLASKLESANDPIAEYLLEGLVKKLKTDEVIQNYFKGSLLSNENLDSRVEQLYFGGYFSKYDLSLFEFDTAGKPIRQSLNKSLSYFDDILNSKSIPTFNSYFYYQSNAYGVLTYYGKIPIYKSGNHLGYLIIELKSKYFRDENIFPELLLEGSLKMNKDFNAYSYSVYKQGKLVSQQGDYAYSLQDLEFNNASDGYQFVETNSYSHLIYKPSSEITIVVSKPIESSFRVVTLSSYLFGIFSLCLSIFFLRRYLSKRFFQIFRNIAQTKWNFRIMLRTRIQLSLILVIVVSLTAVGYITFMYITDQYTKQQNERLSQKVRSILISLERRSAMINNWNIGYDERMSIELKTLSDLYLTDINIFGLNGQLLISTQPKIYEAGLISRHMNSNAFMVMARYERSEYSHFEQIGSLNYLSSYAPIRNSSNRIVGYLNLPYFANKTEYESRASQFLTAFINVYVFIFVIIGFLAFFISNRITFPLALIQEQLRETKIGKKMDKIDWKGKDEIGRLIDEYNRMIEELAESTQRLARSERESAWREMAKQVAHEIKNPLTPMKLGIQHLQRAWIDKDPGFEEKFDRFSKSIIQQIESLSAIASEFSNFAQMPATQLVPLNIVDVVVDVVNLYRAEHEVEINIHYNPNLKSRVLADQDQMARSFNNLIKNAIQSIPSGRKGILQIEIVNEQEQLIVILQDNGSGIPDEMKEKIFQPNFTTKNSGMGMGLAIVSNVIKQTNGKIWFDSSPNIGSTFYVSLPLYQGE